MIAVIADDFTGAAEIAGIGIRQGFDVIIQTEAVRAVSADILIIATNTRSQKPEKSRQLLEKITRDLMALKPDFIYKKIDSLLRGNVGEELLMQLQASQKERALLVPANPELKRTIKDGVYYFEGKPLKENKFFHSNGGPASSDVLELIGERTRPFATVCSADNDLPEHGLIIGNAENAEDLSNWGSKIDSVTIPAGGGSFFDALLRIQGGTRTKEKIPLVFGKKSIHVCGSVFTPSRLAVEHARNSGQTVINMPQPIFCDREKVATLIDGWAQEIIRGIETADKVIVAVDKVDCDKIEDLPVKVSEAVADVIAKVISSIKIEELMIEGGATAYAIIKKLKYTTFYPTQELAQGVTRMKIEDNKDLFMTLKPGSYKWPALIWQH